MQHIPLHCASGESDEQTDVLAASGSVATGGGHSKR